MRLVTYKHHEKETVGVDFNEKYLIDILKLAGHRRFLRKLKTIETYTEMDMLDLIRGGETSLSEIKTAISILNDILNEEKGERELKGSGVLLEKRSVKITAPIKRPPMILCQARNYLDHAGESKYPTPKEPAIFAKAPTAIIGPDDHIIYPKMSKSIAHEIELAIIIGKKGRNLTRNQALDAVFGYTVFNDVTARDLQVRDIKEIKPWSFMPKSFDTFAPIGPCIVTKDQIGDPNDLKMELRVNGETKQSSNTKNMIFKIPDIVQYISAFMTLLPGTIIATGTPRGIGPLHPGDVVEAEIERIGILKNTVVSE